MLEWPIDPRGRLAPSLGALPPRKHAARSGDGGWSDGLAAAAKGADLFIAECYYYDKKIPYHMNLETLTEHLGDIAPKRLILTHMSEDMLERIKSLDFETAEDGKIVEI